MRQLSREAQQSNLPVGNYRKDRGPASPAVLHTPNGATTGGLFLFMIRPPAFQFYGDDFLGGTQNFTDSERGLYITLLCVQWSTGSIPNSDEELSLYSRNSTPLDKVKAKFKLCKDGRLRNQRMESERRKQLAFRRSRAENGKKGGRPRKPSENQVVLKTEPKKSSPSPSPSPYTVVLHQTNLPDQTGGDGGVASLPVGWKDPLEIPKELHCPEFSAAWQKWMTVRRGGKKVKDWAALFSEQLEWLVQFGSAEATAILKQSIRNGWQGLFERKNHGTNQPNNRPHRNDGIISHGPGRARRILDERKAREAAANASASERVATQMG